MKCKRDFAKLRNSLSQMFLKLGVLKNFANFTGKRLCWSRAESLFNKVTGLKANTDSKTGVFL